MTTNVKTTENPYPFTHAVPFNDEATLTPEEAMDYTEESGDYYGHGEGNHERWFDAALQQILDELHPVEYETGLNPRNNDKAAHDPFVVETRVRAGRLIRHHGIDFRPEVRPYVYEHGALMDEADWGAINRDHLARKIRAITTGHAVTEDPSHFWIGLADMAIEQAEKEGLL